MQTILLPTDFQEHSEKALEFAILIARQTNAKIIVTHSFFIATGDIYLPGNIYQELYDDQEKESLSLLDLYCRRISEHCYEDGMPIAAESMVKFDLPASEILSVLREHHIDLIVMGTSCNDHLFGMLGSVTWEVLNHSQCPPVLVVHAETALTDFKNVYMAIKNISEELPKLMQALPLVKAFQATLTIFHIDKLPLSIDEISDLWQERKEHERFLEQVKNEQQYKNIHLQYTIADEPFPKIDNVLSQKMPDLLVFIHHKTPWWEDLFRTHMTRQLLKKEQLPLLVLH